VANIKRDRMKIYYNTRSTMLMRENFAEFVRNNNIKYLVDVRPKDIYIPHGSDDILPARESEALESLLDELQVAEYRSVKELAMICVDDNHEKIMVAEEIVTVMRIARDIVESIRNSGNAMVIGVGNGVERTVASAIKELINLVYGPYTTFGNELLEETAQTGRASLIPDDIPF